MKKVIYVTIIVTILIPFISAKADGGDKYGGRSMLKTSWTLSSTRFNINNISTPVYNDGSSDFGPLSNSSGLYYPKGSGKTAVYESGVLWGGKIDGKILLGGSAYRSGLQPGRIMPDGLAQDPSDPEARLYRVRPDYKTADLSSEVSDGEGTADQVRAQYEKDWNEWPAKYGAPYEDVNKDGMYEPAVDVPGVPGADQTIWYVANDLDSSRTKNMYGSPSIGIEVQVTFWGYKDPSPFGDAIFKKYRIINRSGHEIKDMYIGQWADVDDGSAGDDVVGCDSSLQLGFTYNFTNKDAVYGAFTPAVGFACLLGPAVDGSPSDTAVINDNYVAGKKNLPMSSFIFFAGGDANLGDPPQGTYNGTLQMYNFLRGTIGLTGEPFKEPAEFGGGVTKFPVSGDPVTGTGWLDGYGTSEGGLPSGDRRMATSCGPFNMAQNDTQTVVFAEIVAGDQNVYHHLAGVSLLKARTNFIRNYIPELKDIRKEISVLPASGTGLHREVVLNWGGSYDSLLSYENFNHSGFKFEGYKIYQLKSPAEKLSDGKVVATFDKINGLKTIISDYVDPRSGRILNRVDYSGNDTGLKYTLDLKRDSITGGWLNDGTKYYFAVTGYFYNPEPGLIPNTFESPYKVITVIPQTSDPGIIYEGKMGQVLAAVHTKGHAADNIFAVVTDPASLTGHKYRIEFDSVSSGLVWSLTDVSTGGSKIKNAGLNDSLLVVDGIQYSIRPDKPGFLSPGGGIVEIKYGGKELSPSEYDAAGSEFGGNSVWHSLNSYQSIRYYLSAGGGDGGFGRLLQHPEILDNRDFEIRFNSGINYAVKGFTSDSIITTPFQIWDLGAGTPDDNSDDRQMIPFVYENRPGFNTIQFSGDTDPFFGYPASDWIFFADPEGKDGYDKFAAECQKSGGAGGLYRPKSDGSPDGYWADLHGNNEFPISNLTFCDLNSAGQWPPAGTVIRFYSSKTYTSNDVFEINSPGISEDRSLAKEDVKAINVFPNPYYGANPNETGKYDRFVTFNHLPQRAIIRIFNLAGGMVRRIDKNDPSQFIHWNLLNEGNYQVGSGLYIVYIEMPDLGVTKILKLSVIQPDIIPDHF